MKENKKEKMKEWMIALGIVLGLLVVLTLVALPKGIFEDKVLNDREFDMRLYLLYSVLYILMRIIIIGFWILVGIFGVIMVALIFNKSTFLDWLDRLVAFWRTKAGKASCVVIVLLLALYLPNEEMGEYQIDGKRVIPMQALWYQIQDLQIEPIEATIEACESVQYRYYHNGGRGSSSVNEVYYISYVYEEKKYVTPATSYIYSQLKKADLEKEEMIEVLLYPYTGMIVDFVEKPIALYESDEERLNAILGKYGYPYQLKVTKEGYVESSHDSKYDTLLFDKYKRLLEYEVIWVTYNGVDTYDIVARKKLNAVNMDRDGIYEVQLGKEDGTRLSEKVIYEVKDGFIKKINGEEVYIEAYIPIKAATEDEVYSEEMSRFLKIAEYRGYNIKYDTYHYTFESGGKYFKYKYINAFLGSIQSSIQVYECLNEEDAILTYENWIEVYGTQEIEKGTIYSLKGSTSEDDNGILLLQNNFVYVFWGRTAEEALETAREFGCVE